MTLALTPAIVRAAYDFLNDTPPFSRWNLPDGEDMAFKVATGAAHYGWITTAKRRKAELVVSSATVGYTLNLLATVAHEMVHLHQHQLGLPTTHGATFKKFAAQVCRVHGFDPKLF